MKENELKRSTAILWIVLATIVISGFSYGGYFSFRRWDKKRVQDDAYKILSIIQTGPQKEALKSTYLAELMDLSIDRPTNLYLFDTALAEKKLLTSPLIQKAKVKKYKPGSIYVDYSIRQPIAWLYDYENTVIDQEGRIFPVYPFLSPKTLPEIYLGIHEDLPLQNDWQNALVGKYVELALKTLSLLSDPRLRDFFDVVRIDVSNAYAESYGKREIVLLTEDKLKIPYNQREIFCLFSQDASTEHRRLCKTAWKLPRSSSEDDERL